MLHEVSAPPSEKAEGVLMLETLRFVLPRFNTVTSCAALVEFGAL